VVLGPAFAQEGGQKPVDAAGKAAKEKAVAPERTASKPELPFQIQLLETHIRFEANGDSRKNVHTIVKINNVLGAHEFARLTFDYNRAFQEVEIPLVRISHANGGTSELLPSAVTDAPNPAVEKFPAYQDVRVKSVRILGLAEGDTIEYRVITTTTKHPLAPDFWLEHTFDRSGQVLEELYELDLPTPHLRMSVNPEAPANKSENTGEGESARALYRWDIVSDSFKNAQAQASAKSDIVLTTFPSWAALSTRMSRVDVGVTTRLWYDIMEAAGAPKEPVPPDVIYKLISQKVATIDLPVDLCGYLRREPEEILKSGYGSPVEKARLLMYAMLQNKDVSPGYFVMYGGGSSLEDEFPRPTLLTGTLGVIRQDTRRVFLAIDIGEAPFGMIPANVRGHQALMIGNFVDDLTDRFLEIPRELPFPAKQRVTVEAAITAGGELRARVKYALRGDNELLLRVAFHQTAKEKWKDVAGLLAIADGFRGQVMNVNISDPMATKDPFTVEYEITQAKFVDWAKKPVRIPALLPQIGLPDPPAKTAAGEAAHTIELGTPLDVDTQMTLKLPAGTVAQLPAGTSVERDYAKFSSKYSAAANTVTASRRVNFLLREISGDRAMDYSTFLRAVQSDQAQLVTLVRDAVEEKR